MANSKQVVIVTGASAGIGKSVVRKFLKLGCVVYALARRVEAMQDLKNEGAQIHRVDLTDPENISSFVQGLLKEEGRVDILVNNAGYGSYGAVEEVPMKEARAQIDVNVFAPALLIQEVLPTMRKQKFGKIVNVSSIGGKFATPMGGWYHASKFALEGLSDALRQEVRPFGVDVIVIEPGGIKTEWGEIASQNGMKVSGSGPYKNFAEGFNTMVKGSHSMAADPQIISNLIERAVTARRPKARYVAPFHGKVFLFLRWLLNDRAMDFLFAKMFQVSKTL